MYSPKISETLVKELYQLKLRIKRPMTHLVNEAIAQYLKNISKGLISVKENDNERQ